jgi:hypothetical protein
VYFSSEDDASCEPSENHPGFTVKHIPLPRGVYEGGCYNLADLFASNYSNVSIPGLSNATSSITRDSNRLNVTALNRAAFNVNANYSRIWYQQTNETMYGTTAPGEIAARLLNVYPDRDCKQGKGYPPEDIGLAPYYSWNCQSEAEGECYSTPEEIQSFGISSAALYGETYGGHCFAMEARGSAAELKPWRCFLTIVVGLMLVVGVVL